MHCSWVSAQECVLPDYTATTDPSRGKALRQSCPPPLLRVQPGVMDVTYRWFPSDEYIPPPPFAAERCPLALSLGKDGFRMLPRAWRATLQRHCERAMARVLNEEPMCWWASDSF